MDGVVAYYMDNMLDFGWCSSPGSSPDQGHYVVSEKHTCNLQVLSDCLSLSSMDINVME